MTTDYLEYIIHGYIHLDGFCSSSACSQLIVIYANINYITKLNIQFVIATKGFIFFNKCQMSFFN